MDPVGKVALVAEMVLPVLIAPLAAPLALIDREYQMDEVLTACRTSAG